MGACNRVVVIGWDFFESQVCVQCPGGFHVAQCVKQHAGVTRLSCCVQNGFSQNAAEPQTPERRANVQAFHFACVGVIHIVDLAQRATTRKRPFYLRSEQHARRRGIGPRQIRKLLGEALKT